MELVSERHYPVLVLSLIQAFQCNPHFIGCLLISQVWNKVVSDPVQDYSLSLSYIHLMNIKSYGICRYSYTGVRKQPQFVFLENTAYSNLPLQVVRNPLQSIFKPDAGSHLCPLDKEPFLPSSSKNNSKSLVVPSVKCCPLNFKAKALIPCRFLMTKISQLKFCQTLSKLEITVFINFINAKPTFRNFHKQKYTLLSKICTGKT
jgi:hypothetical protein